MTKDFGIENRKLGIRLQGVVNGLTEELAETLEGCLDEIKGKLIKLAERADDTDSMLRAKRYLESQRKAIEKVLDEVYKDMGKQIKDRAVEVGQETPEICQKILFECTEEGAKKTIEKAFAVKELSKEQLLKQIEFLRVDGATIAERLSRMSESLSIRVMAEIRSGVIFEETFYEIGERIDRVANTGLKEASILAEDMVNGAHGYAQTEYYKGNRIKEEIFVATMGSRVCPVCLGLDGQKFPIDEGPRPPGDLHCRCKCKRLPVFPPEVEEVVNQQTRPVEIYSDPRKVRHRPGTKAFERLGKTSTEYGYQDAKTRIPIGKSYTQFLSEAIKSTDPKLQTFAKEVLGETRFNLVRKGKLKLSTFYYNGKFKTVKELKAMI